MERLQRRLLNLTPDCLPASCCHRGKKLLKRGATSSSERHTSTRRLLCQHAGDLAADTAAARERPASQQRAARSGLLHHLCSWRQNTCISIRSSQSPKTLPWGPRNQNQTLWSPTDHTDDSTLPVDRHALTHICQTPRGGSDATQQRSGSRQARMSTATRTHALRLVKSLPCQPNQQTTGLPLLAHATPATDRQHRPSISCSATAAAPTLQRHQAPCTRASLSRCGAAASHHLLHVIQRLLCCCLATWWPCSPD